MDYTPRITTKLKKKYLFSKISIQRINIIYLLYGILLWCLFAFNTENNDYGNYLALYNYTSLGGTDVGIENGYNILMRLCSLMGLSFQGFRCIYAAICLMLVMNFIRRCATSYTYVFILYSIFPFILNTIQIRNYMAIGIMLNAIVFLYKGLNEGKIKRTIFWFVFFVALAAQFHRISYVYLLLLLTCTKTRVLKWIYSVGLIFEITIVFLFPNYRNIIGMFSDKAALYLSEDWLHTQTWTKIVLIIFVIAVPYAMRYFSLAEFMGDRFLEFCYKIMLVGGLYYIFYTISIDFFRIYVGLFPIVYVGYSNAFDKMKLKDNKNIYRIGLLIFALSLCYAFIGFRSNNIYNFFHYNLLINARW